MSDVTLAGSCPPNRQQLTPADRTQYGEPAVIELDPTPPRTPLAAQKLRDWLAWRGAPYPADRHSEYLFLPGDEGSSPKILVSAVLRTPETFAGYIADSPRRRRAHLRANLALRHGYEGARIDPGQHSAAIHEIIHSSQQRQGRPIVERFAVRPPDHDFASARTTGDPRYDDLCVGVFRGGLLAAYLVGRRVDDHVVYEEIMGHADHLDNGIMWLLHRTFLETAAAAAPRPKWLHYGAWYSGVDPFSPTGGLNAWKRKARFKPAYLTHVSS